jgi:cell division protein ZapA
MKQLEVQIMGQSYLLGCQEGGEARLLDAAQQVDLAMCKIRDAGKIRARDRIAVLAALNLAFDLSEPATPADTSATPTPKPTLGAPPPTPVSTTPEPASAQLHALLTRLDAALNDDGRLI